MRADQQFNTLWEGYLFNIATMFIDSASAAQQTKIIHLVNKAGEFLDDENGKVGKQLIDSPNAAQNNSPLGLLEHQWKKALKKPLSERRILKQTRRAILQRSCVLNQQEIESILSCITRMELLIEQVQQSTLTDGAKLRLLDHYQPIKNRYAARLDGLKTIQNRKLKSLNA